MAQINSGASVPVSLPTGSYIDVDGSSSVGTASVSSIGGTVYSLGPMDVRIGPFDRDLTVYMTSQSGDIRYSVGALSRVGMLGVLPISAADVAFPTAKMLTRQDVTYQLSTAPYTRFVSNGTSIVPVGDKAGQASNGLRLGIIGASTEARVHPQWGVTTYTRTNGVVTVVMTFTLADQYFLPGMRIRLACDRLTTNGQAIEGDFDILTSTTSAGVSTTLTYNDPRPDVANSQIPGAATLLVHDKSGWAICGGFPMWLNLALGGRLDIVVVGTGSTNIVTDWGEDRLSQLAAYGDFDAVMIGGGPIGNAINGAGYTPEVVYQALVNLCEQVKATFNPRVVLVETLPLVRSITPSSAVATGSYRLNRMIWRDLTRECAYVRVVPLGEAMAKNWFVYNGTTSSNADYDDVSQGWPEAEMLVADGVHHAQPTSRVRGFSSATVAGRVMAQWTSPEAGVMSDSLSVNTVADAGGKSNPNRATGFWGNIDTTKTTLSGTGISGNGPAGCTVAFEAGRGTSTAVGALSTCPTGGSQWVVTITGNGSTTGYTFAMNNAAAWILTALNANGGKFVDFWLPLSVQLNAYKILWVSVDLVGTVAGREYVIASAQAQSGQFTMAASGRAMDSGYSGVLRFPRFKIPSATYTAGVIRVRVKEINGSVASGQTVVTWGPGQRFEVLES